MAKKPRRDVVQNIIKNLLDLEIPEIQSKTKKLAEQIKELEQHSLKLQDYVTQIENIATEEASALVESRITEILKDLDKALIELRQRSKRTLATSPETRALASKNTLAEETREQEKTEAKEPEEESALPREELRPTTYVTPEGYLVKKSRR
jgi:NADH dehydrogenase/NADH:ubiquinone oxidoreductase subunit G